MGFYLAVSAVTIALCLFFGDWRNWEKYHATILFFILGDLFYNFITYNKPLWTYMVEGLNHTLIDTFIAVTVFPCTVMLFIPKYPRKLRKQIAYVSFWTGIYSIVEYIAYLLGYFTYSNGWNILYSVVLVGMMFVILRLHYTSPLLAYGISAIAVVVVLLYFKIPVSMMR